MLTRNRRRNRSRNEEDEENAAPLSIAPQDENEVILVPDDPEEMDIVPMNHRVDVTISMYKSFFFLKKLFFFE